MAEKPARPDAPPECRYANYFAVGHNAVEFLLDCGQAYPDTEGARIHTRIVTHPRAAFELTKLLLGALSEFERRFGSIDKPDGEAS